jgi:hypothetical protein
MLLLLPLLQCLPEDQATLEVQAQVSPPFCSNAQPVLFNFNVTASNTTVHLDPEIVPNTCTGYGKLFVSACCYLAGI